MLSSVLKKECASPSGVQMAAGCKSKVGILMGYRTIATIVDSRIFEMGHSSVQALNLSISWVLEPPHHFSTEHWDLGNHSLVVVCWQSWEIDAWLGVQFFSCQLLFMRKVSRGIWAVMRSSRVPCSATKATRSQESQHPKIARKCEKPEIELKTNEEKFASVNNSYDSKWGLEVESRKALRGFIAPIKLRVVWSVLNGMKNSEGSRHINASNLDFFEGHLEQTWTSFHIQEFSQSFQTLRSITLEHPRCPRVSNQIPTSFDCGSRLSIISLFWPQSRCSSAVFSFVKGSWRHRIWFLVFLNDPCFPKPYPNVKLQRQCLTR